MIIKRDLIAYARSLGFERVGITSAEPLADEEAYLKTWLDKGSAGEMHYLEKDPERRTHPTKLLPEAKSIIALAMNYYAGEWGNRGTGEREKRPEAISPTPPLARSPIQEGRVARYADGPDYHKVIGKRLDSFVRYMEALAPEVQCRTFVDTGPLLERPVAQRAGLGFIGKNTMLITRGLGSWVFLASVITSLELPVDAPDERSCGDCRLCIDACPTTAITAPYQLDPRRCIAYLTIELDGRVDEKLRPQMGEWIFGCDICQEVCPHNACRQGPSGMRTLNLADILSIRDDVEFRSRFAGTALMRAERHGLVRNACLAAANLERRDLLPALKELAQNDSHLIVREQAAWAVEQLSVVGIGVAGT